MSTYNDISKLLLDMTNAAAGLTGAYETPAKPFKDKEKKLTKRNHIFTDLKKYRKGE